MKYREIEHLYESEKRLKLKFDGIYFNSATPVNLNLKYAHNISLLNRDQRPQRLFFLLLRIFFSITVDKNNKIKVSANCGFWYRCEYNLLYCNDI